MSCLLLFCFELFSVFVRPCSLEGAVATHLSARSASREQERVYIELCVVIACFSFLPSSGTHFVSASGTAVQALLPLLMGDMCPLLFLLK